MKHKLLFFNKVNQVKLIKGFYIQITPDGIGRIDSQTVNNILGLYTSSIQTCFAIGIIGSNDKISLIHKTSVMDYNEIKSELIWVGDIKEIIIIYNPDYDKYRVEYETYDALVKKLFEITTVLGIKEFHLGKHHSSKVTIHRNGKISTEHLSDFTQLPPYPNLRETINTLNNFFSTIGNLSADRQYIDNKWISLPSFSLDVLNSINSLNKLESKNIGTLYQRLIEMADSRHESFFTKVKTQYSQGYTQEALNTLKRVATLFYELFNQLKNFPEYSERNFRLVENQNLFILREITGIEFYGHLNNDFSADAIYYSHSITDIQYIEEKLTDLGLIYKSSFEKAVITSLDHIGYVRCIKVTSINVEKDDNEVEMNGSKLRLYSTSYPEAGLL